jgi:hypothetical protein
MSVFLQPIYTQTASGSAQTITFNNIPQGFTDLKVVFSIRSAISGSAQDYVQMRFNGVSSGSLYSDTRLEGTGSSAASARDTSGNEMYFAWAAPGANATANTFGNAEIYIPNYTSSNFKSVNMDYVNENNASAIQYIGLTAGLFRSTSAITSMTIGMGNANFVSNSTISIYGITRG